MIRYSDFWLQPLRNHKFKLLVEVNYKGIRVPAGYVTDGASIPRIFWSIFPPNRTDYLPCAIIHDYLCDLEKYDLADKCFKSCLKDLHIDPLTIKLFTYSVKVYHFLRYKLPKSIQAAIKG